MEVSQILSKDEWIHKMSSIHMKTGSTIKKGWVIVLSYTVDGSGKHPAWQMKSWTEDRGFNNEMITCNTLYIVCFYKLSAFRNLGSVTMAVWQLGSALMFLAPVTTEEGRGLYRVSWSCPLLAAALRRNVLARLQLQHYGEQTLHLIWAAQ